MSRTQLVLAALLTGLIIGVPIGLHGAYGTAVRDHSDATYYRERAHALADALDRCVSVSEDVMHEAEGARRMVVALLGRVVRIETPVMTETDR